jgi:hypothetical protein
MDEKRQRGMKELTVTQKFFIAENLVYYYSKVNEGNAMCMCDLIRGIIKGDFHVTDIISCYEIIDYFPEFIELKPSGLLTLDHWFPKSQAAPRLACSEKLLLNLQKKYESRSTEI